MQPNEQSMSNTASDFGRAYDYDREPQARRGMDLRQIKTTVADRLHEAADKLHQKSAQGGQESELTRFGHRAADWMNRSADYVHDLEPQQLRDDLENQVRRNPGRSLLIAGAVGLLLGGLLRRR